MQNILMLKYLHIIIEVRGCKQVLEILSLGLHIMQPKHKREHPRINKQLMDGIGGKKKVSLWKNNCNISEF